MTPTFMENRHQFVGKLVPEWDLVQGKLSLFLPRHIEMENLTGYVA